MANLTVLPVAKELLDGLPILSNNTAPHLQHLTGLKCGGREEIRKFLFEEYLQQGDFYTALQCLEGSRFEGDLCRRLARTALEKEVFSIALEAFSKLGDLKAISSLGKSAIERGDLHLALSCLKRTKDKPRLITLGERAVARKLFDVAIEAFRLGKASGEKFLFLESVAWGQLELCLHAPDRTGYSEPKFEVVGLSKRIIEAMEFRAASVEERVRHADYMRDNGYLERAMEIYETLEHPCAIKSLKTLRRMAERSQRYSIVARAMKQLGATYQDLHKLADKAYRKGFTEEGAKASRLAYDMEAEEVFGVGILQEWLEEDKQEYAKNAPVFRRQRGEAFLKVGRTLDAYYSFQHSDKRGRELLKLVAPRLIIANKLYEAFKALAFARDGLGLQHMGELCFTRCAKEIRSNPADMLELHLRASRDPSLAVLFEIKDPFEQLISKDSYIAEQVAKVELRSTLGNLALAVKIASFERNLREMFMLESSFYRALWKISDKTPFQVPRPLMDRELAINGSNLSISIAEFLPCINLTDLNDGSPDWTKRRKWDVTRTIAHSSKFFHDWLPNALTELSLEVDGRPVEIFDFLKERQKASRQSVVNSAFDNFGINLSPDGHFERLYEGVYDSGVKKVWNKDVKPANWGFDPTTGKVIAFDFDYIDENVPQWDWSRFIDSTFFEPCERDQALQLFLPLYEGDPMINERVYWYVSLFRNIGSTVFFWQRASEYASSKLLEREARAKEEACTKLKASFNALSRIEDKYGDRDTRRYIFAGLEQMARIVFETGL